MAYATETEKYAKEAQDYLDRTHEYLNNKLPGRTIRLVDPRDERFSQAAEDVRQHRAILKADSQSEQDAPRTFDLEEADPTDQPRVLDLTGAQPER